MIKKITIESTDTQVEWNYRGSEDDQEVSDIMLAFEGLIVSTGIPQHVILEWHTFVLSQQADAMGKELVLIEKEIDTETTNEVKGEC